MLPPNRPESVVRIAHCWGGATATQPSIGLKGTVKSFRASGGRSSRAIRAAASIVQRLLNESAHFRPAKWPGSTAAGITVLPLTAHARFVRMRFRRTTSVSPGMAPST